LNLIDGIKRPVKLGFIVYLISTILAFWFPIAALVLNLLLWLVWITLSYNAKSD
jgi:hypothetical protein